MSGNWSAHDTAEASGGRYLYSSGSPADTLSLSFTGTRLDVIFVQHPALGSFDLVIDETPVQTVDCTASDSAFGAHLSLNLAAGSHTLRIVPVSGVVAIDAFAVEAVSEPSVPPVTQATAEPVITLEPVTEQPAQPTPDSPADLGRG